MSTRNEIRRKVLDIMQRGNMRRIAYMNGYVFSRCMPELSSTRFQSASRVKMWNGVSFRERGKFHDVVRTFQKRRKKLHKTGLNRFCTQTRLGKRVIIVSIKPKTTELGLLTLTLTGNCISTTDRRSLTFH